MLGLEELLERRPGALSGGQRQRVAMGRAIVREPAAFLMDEPLSNLDAKLRVDMRAELARLHERLSVTTIYVTHDQVEAMTLGTRVAVMRAGTIQQVDTPQTLYRSPANLFVAAFIGSPAMNLVEAEVGEDDVAFAGYRVPARSRPPPGRGAGDRLILGIRPQDFTLAETAGRPGSLEVEAAVVEELGSATHVLFTLDAPPVDVDAVRAATDEGDVATLLATDRRALFTAEVPEGTEVRPGQKLHLVLDRLAAPLLRPGERREPRARRGRAGRGAGLRRADATPGGARGRARRSRLPRRRRAPRCGAPSRPARRRAPRATRRRPPA